ACCAIPSLLRRSAFEASSCSRVASSTAGPALFKSKAAPGSPQKKALQANGFAGGPRQISLQLKASKPALRHGAVPPAQLSGRLDLTKVIRAKLSRDSSEQMEEPNREVALIAPEIA